MSNNRQKGQWVPGSGRKIDGEDKRKAFAGPVCFGNWPETDQPRSGVEPNSGGGTGSPVTPASFHFATNVGLG
jgi:hypothetical protein